MKIKDLRDGMKRIDVTGRVTEKSEVREVSSKYKDVTYRVATVIITDGTDSVKLTLWDDQIEQVNLNDTVSIENGYITTFRGEIQLNVGKYGKLSIS